MGSAVRILSGGNLAKFAAVTNGTSPTVAATFLLTLADEIIKTTVTRDDASGRYDATFDQVKDDATLQAYFEANISATSSAIEGITFEDGVKELASTSSNTTQLAIIRGGLQGGTAGSARKIGLFPMRLKNSSGAWTQEGEKYNRVSFAMEGYKLGGALAIASALLSGVATTGVACTLTTSLPYGTVVYQ